MLLLMEYERPNFVDFVISCGKTRNFIELIEFEKQDQHLCLCFAKVGFAALLKITASATTSLKAVESTNFGILM